MGFLETVLAGLIVAAIGGATGMLVERARERKRYRQRHEAAVKQFAGELRKLIANANPEGNDAITTAQAIVSVRNSLRRVLTSLSDSLNSDITTLEKLVGEGKIPSERQDEIRQRLSVLKKTWPSKEPELEVAVRKVLAELGFEPE